MAVLSEFVASEIAKLLKNHGVFVEIEDRSNSYDTYFVFIWNSPDKSNVLCMAEDEILTRAFIKAVMRFEEKLWNWIIWWDGEKKRSCRD